MVPIPPLLGGPIAVRAAWKRLMRRRVPSRMGSLDHQSLSASLWTMAITSLGMGRAHSQYLRRPKYIAWTTRLRPKYDALKSAAHLFALSLVS